MTTAAIGPAVQTAAQAATQKSAAAGVLSAGGDFDTFLKLLTTQLRNQDPLNPQESTEFVAQLAQFSAVEQQIKSNDTLGQILSALGGTGPATLAPWLGSRVEAAAPLAFDGTALVALRVDPAPEATAAALVVKTESGLTVARLPVDPKATSLAWAGETGGAAPAPAGTYRFTVERLNGKESLPVAEARGFADVVEARMGAGGVELVLDSGAAIPADSVTAIRKAGPAA